MNAFEIFVGWDQLALASAGPPALFAWVLKGSLVIAAGYLTLAALIRCLRIESSAVRQFGVLAVFLAAVCPWKMPLEIACLPVEENELAFGSHKSIDADTTAALAGLFAASDDEERRSQQSAGQASAATAPFDLWHFISRVSLRFLYFAGGSILFSLAAIRYLLFLRRVETKLPAEAHWQAEWQQLQQTRLGREIIPLHSTLNIGPMLARLPRQFALFLPAAYWQELSARQRRTILRHELAHYERGDIWRACVIRFLALPFWFHPLAWRLVAMFDEAAEDACDRAAAGRHDSLPYAQALERLAAAPTPAISPALGQSAQTHPLVQRVRRVLSPHPKDSFMKLTLSAIAVCALAVVSLLQIRLVAEDKPAKGPATIESVKADAQGLKAKLEELKANVELVKQDLMKLKERVEGKVHELKELASDPNNISGEAQGLVEDLKSGEEARQLKALEAAEKLKSKDEALIVCGYLAKDGASEAVRQKALTIAATKGEEGLAVFAHAFEGLNTTDRIFAIEQLAKQKDTHPAVFARISQDVDEGVKVAAITAGLKTKDPLIFLALAAESNEDIATIVLPRLTLLEKEHQRLALFAAALKGNEKVLPELVDKAAALDEAGYPIIAAIYERKTPESRAAIVRAFAKSTVEIEALLVTKARTDSDPALREAAEKATDGFGATGIGAEEK